MLDRLAEQVNCIYKRYFDHSDVEGTAGLVGLDEIKENGWNLNIPRYIEPVIEDETITVAKSIENLKSSMKAAYEADGKLRRLISEHGMMK